ncbi:hypothetical protein M0G43_08930 [Subsaxibacter sp. CAU 1640]|uniref:hypothetical protein n=1 Tax=Subsaxibacter sp. CAU 1640 TaxID=2933271 RepID=UPI002005085C|nr:hypothetical protein [Subsaxibacter sp. CAU 1640]MCK7590696.1 hypothetical protein [Subsaxibacter sp. CAU 1640]
MKAKFTLIGFLFLLIVGSAFAQKNEPQSIISGKVSIAKYHDRDELDKMQKGQLLDLYNERIEVIVKILPNIAFATKPGVTMSTLGIPDTKENRKALEDNIQASKTYFDSTIEFQRKVLPYSDKSNLIAAILFYEETLKSLHTYNEFNRN